jgi:allophanate hydrolase subunit 1
MECATVQCPVQGMQGEEDDKAASVATYEGTHHKVRDVTEEELQSLMGMSPAVVSMTVNYRKYNSTSFILKA